MISLFHRRRKAYAEPRTHTDFGPWAWTFAIAGVLFVLLKML